jgi:para-nitrobenzyl esterase
LPYQQVDPAGLAISKDIPFMLGCTKNEFMASLMNPAIRDFTKEQAVDFLKKRYADKTDAYLKAVEKAYPNTTKPSDYIDIDLAFRPGMVKHANLKSRFWWSTCLCISIYMAISCKRWYVQGYSLYRIGFCI